MFAFNSCLKRCQKRNIIWISFKFISNNQPKKKNRSGFYARRRSVVFCFQEIQKHTLKHNHNLFPQTASYIIHFIIQSTLLNTEMCSEIVKFSHNVNVDIEKNFQIVTWLFYLQSFFFVSYINTKIMYHFPLHQPIFHLHIIPKNALRKAKMLHTMVYNCSNAFLSSFSRLFWFLVSCYDGVLTFFFIVTI